jgi:hypothetical protein
MTVGINLDSQHSWVVGDVNATGNGKRMLANEKASRSEE